VRNGGNPGLCDVRACVFVYVCVRACVLVHACMRKGAHVA
jgi:hypothetical protein